MKIVYIIIVLILLCVLLYGTIGICISGLIKEDFIQALSGFIMTIIFIIIGIKKQLNNNEYIESF